MSVHIKANPHMPDRVNTAQRNWIWQVTTLALFLGAILGASLRAQQNFRQHNIFPNRNGVPPAEYARQVKRNNELQGEIAQLNEEKARMVRAMSGGEQLSTVKKELEDAKALAALTAASGPGVIVTLSDVPRDKYKALGIAAEESLIHDVDILQVVNELRAAGAEALAISDQRLTATSPIRCVGELVLVNTAPVSVPVRIIALGDQTQMLRGLKMNGGIMDPASSRLALLNMISVQKEPQLTVPAYAGPATMGHIKPGP